MSKKIILASKSGVRKKILDQNNIICEVIPANVDEDSIKESLIKEKATPKIISKNLAEVKANKVSQKKPEEIVLGADSVIDLDGELISKPTNREEAINILKFVPELLDYIDKEDTYLAVVSNKNGALLREEIDFLRWNNLFSSIVGADDAIRDKPDRAPIDMALDGSGILNSTQVWFVGDAPSDIECAHNAGVLGVLIQNEASQQKKIGQFQPHLTFKNAGELLKYLNLIKQSGQKGFD